MARRGREWRGREGNVTRFLPPTTSLTPSFLPSGLLQIRLPSLFQQTEGRVLAFGRLRSTEFWWRTFFALSYRIEDVEGSDILSNLKTVTFLFPLAGSKRASYSNSSNLGFLHPSPRDPGDPGLFSPVGASRPPESRGSWRIGRPNCFLGVPSS